MTDTYWFYPGVPSIVVPYGNTVDYYFSGHTGFTVITTIYMYRKGYYICFALGVFVFFYIIQILLLFKVHYSIGKPEVLPYPFRYRNRDFRCPLRLLFWDQICPLCRIFLQRYSIQACDRLPMWGREAGTKKKIN